MPTIPGENLVPRGGLTGAAYVLGANTPSALSVLVNGQRQRALAAQREAAERAKRDAQNAKDYNDTVKFKQDGSPYFATGLEQQVYSPLTGQLTDVFKQNRDDAFARNAAARPLLQKANNETVQSESKTKFLHDTMGGFQADKNLIDATYAGTHLSAALHDGSRNRLPSEFDAEAWKDGIMGDEKLYKEKEVILRATKGLAPTISQKIAEAGQLGGQHTADMVRGRFVAFDGQGRPILNADKSPKFNITSDTQALLEDDPLFKMKADAREAAYNAKREADPSLPVMSRRGHIAQMVGPLAFYDQAHDETLIRPHFARAAAAGTATDTYTPAGPPKVENRYSLPNDLNTHETKPGFNGAPIFTGALAPMLNRMLSTPTATITRTEHRPDYAVYGPDIAAPADYTKQGVRKDKKNETFTPKEFSIMSPGGKGIHVKGNKNVMPGYVSKINKVYVDAKTGDHIYPQTEAEGTAAVAAGTAKIGVQFDYDTDKTQPSAADVKSAADELMLQKDSNYKPKYADYKLAEADARKKLTGGTIRTTQLYKPEDSNYMDGHFGTKMRQVLKDAEADTRRIRGEGQQQAAPATKENTGGAYQRKATTTPNQKKATKSTTGGAY